MPTKTKQKNSRVSSFAGKKSSKKRKTAHGEQCFFVYNGPCLSSLEELKEALEYMSEEQIAHHTKDGNHFADWVRDVLCDEDCAAALGRARSRGGYIRACESCL